MTRPDTKEQVSVLVENSKVQIEVGLQAFLKRVFFAILYTSLTVMPHKSSVPKTWQNVM
jgi:hypothetical protein